MAWDMDMHIPAYTGTPYELKRLWHLHPRHLATSSES